MFTRPCYVTHNVISKEISICLAKTFVLDPYKLVRLTYINYGLTIESVVLKTTQVGFGQISNRY